MGNPLNLNLNTYKGNKMRGENFDYPPHFQPLGASDDRAVEHFCQTRRAAGPSLIIHAFCSNSKHFAPAKAKQVQAR